MPVLVLAAPLSVLEQAAAGIEAHRKADAEIRVVRKDGTALPGAKVEVVQRTHDFAFGNVFRPCHYENEKYRTKFLELFNFIELVEFNWGQYEREEGKPKLADRRDMEFMNGWCRQNGLERFYFHMLVWTSAMVEKAGAQVPPWLFKYDKATQYELLKSRIQRDVAAYKDFDVVWNVVNEPVHCRVWGDWEKDGYVQNRQAEPIARIQPYVKDFTEFCYTSDPANDIRGKYRQVKWSPEKQGEAIEEFYRVAFEHPAVAGIVYFGMGDDDPLWMSKQGLLDESFQPKPAWERLKRLIKEEWNTRQSGSADTEGAYAFRGFCGQYEVSVTAAGKHQTFHAHLEQGKPNVWSFVVD